MPRRNLLFLLLACVLSLAILMPAAEATHRLDVSPQEIVMKEVLSDGYYVTELILESPHEIPDVFVLGAVGPVKDWVTFEPSRVAANRDFPARVKIKVRPQGALEGVYSGFVTIGVESKNLITPAVINGMEGIPINVLVTTEEMKEINIERVISENIEEDDPLRVGVRVWNKGNAPAAVVARAFVSSTTKPDFVLANDSAEVKTAPGEIVNFLLEPKVDLTPGDYIVETETFLREHLFLSHPHAERDFLHVHTSTIKVYKAGELPKAGRITGIRIFSPTVNAPAAITIGFENLGYTPVLARVLANLTFDGEKSAVEGEPVLVGAGESVNLSAKFTPWRGGELRINGFVEYDGLATKPITAAVFVLGGSELFGGAGVGGFFGLALGGIFLFWLYRRWLGKP